jgi:hypothetical protein
MNFIATDVTLIDWLMLRQFACNYKHTSMQYLPGFLRLRGNSLGAAAHADHQPEVKRRLNTHVDV